MDPRLASLRYCRPKRPWSGRLPRKTRFKPWDRETERQRLIVDGDRLRVGFAVSEFQARTWRKSYAWGKHVKAGDLWCCKAFGIDNQ